MQFLVYGGKERRRKIAWPFPGLTGVFQTLTTITVHGHRDRVETLFGGYTWVASFD